MMICRACARGNHNHDRWTGAGKPGHAGEDAGCPNVAEGTPFSSCQCAVVLAPVQDTRGRHCPTCRCGR